MRITFDLVSYYANLFLQKMALANSREESLYYSDLYFSYVESCGWSDIEFDRELLRRIDDNWDLMYN